MAKKAKKHAGGRPRKYNSADQMQIAIDDYFVTTTKLSICGLALHLGFDDRHSLINYAGYSKEYFTTIKRAKLRIEAYYEEHLVEKNAAGSIFALKNFDWKDKVEQATTIKVDPGTTLRDEIKTMLSEDDDAGDAIPTD